MKKKITAIVAICIASIALMTICNTNKVNAAPADANSYINVQGIVVDQNGNQVANMSEYKVPVSISYINNGETTLLRKFDFQAGETVDFYQYESSAIKNKTCLISVPNNIKFKNWKIVANGTDLGQNPYEFVWEDGLKLDVKIFVEDNSDSEIKISSILLDKEMCPPNENWIKDYMNNPNLYEYLVEIVKQNASGQMTKTYYLYPGETLDLLKLDPSFFENKSAYYLTIYNNDRWYVEKMESDFNGTVKNIPDTSGRSYDSFFIMNDGKYNLNIYGKIMCNSISFDVQYYDEDDPDMTHAPEYHLFDMNLSGLISGVEYFRLISEDDDKVNYAYAGTVPLKANNTLPDVPEGWTNVVKVYNNKRTEVFIPTSIGGEWNYYGKDEYQPGAVHGYITSYGQMHTNQGIVVNSIYTNKYDVKTFNKTDVNGNPADASFEAYFYDQNKKQNSKYVYKHYDSRVIKGVTYENVYEVVGATDVDDTTSNSTIETKDGKFSLYYPYYYQDYYDFDSQYYINMGFGRTHKGGSERRYYLTEKIWVKEIGASDGFVINPDVTQIQTSTEKQAIYYHNSYISGRNDRPAEYNWDEIYPAIEVYPAESEDSYTYVNKKKPTVQEILDDGADYDGEFEFEVYDVETGELVGKVRAPSRKIVALEPKVTDSEGNTTGYLEDGKKYRVVKKEIEDIENYDVKTTKGETGEDESKYVEFTFSGDLDDICDIVFYDKQIKKEEPEEEEPAEEPTEDEEETPAEEKEDKTDNKEEAEDVKEETEEAKEEKSNPRTGDMINIAFATIVLSGAILFITIKKRS